MTMPPTEHDPTLDHSAPEEFDSEVGETTIDPVQRARAPQKRRGMFLVAISVAAMAVIAAVIIVRGDGEAPPPPPIVSEAGAVIADTGGASVTLPTTDGPAAAGDIPIDTTMLLPTADPLTSDLPAQAPPAPDLGALDVAFADTPAPQAPNPLAAAPLDTAVQPLPVDGAEQQRRRDSVAAERRQAQRDREVADSVARENRLAAIREAQTQLRRPMSILQGELPEGASGVAGRSRFADPGSAGAGVTAEGVGGGSAISGVEIPPGTRVPAVTTTNYRSDLPGGKIEARLTAPLVVGGRTLLPAGTRAYADASSTGGDIGPAYVHATFTTFVTPQGEIMRSVRAVAGDPASLTTAVRADKDRQMGQRLTRGVLATVLETALAWDTRRMGALESPSAKDLAIMSGQQRVRDVLGANVGSENSFQTVVQLPAGTALVLLFGL